MHKIYAGSFGLGSALKPLGIKTAEMEPGLLVRLGLI